MNKTTLILLLIFTLLMTACVSSTSDSTGPDSITQSGPAAGDLSAAMQVAIGTIKLDETKDAVTAEQAAELLPLWQTLQVLYSSDTAAEQEIDALIAQIQETMTAEQNQSITALNLTRQDMMSIMQSQGMMVSGAQNGNTERGPAANNNGGGFVPGGGGFAGGPPPDGAFPGGGADSPGTRPQSTDSTEGGAPQMTVNPNRIPTPIVQAVIEYLKNKINS